MLKIVAIWVTRNIASGCHSGSKSNHSRHRHAPVGQIDRQSLSPTTQKDWSDAAPRKGPIYYVLVTGVDHSRLFRKSASFLPAVLFL